MPTEAQRRAVAKCKRERTRGNSLTFYPAERDLLEWLESQPNQSGYLKALIRQDMDRARKG